MVVVITGASAGVGRATARAFAKSGTSLGLIARGKDRLELAVQEAKALGVRAVAVSADVSDAAAVEAAAGEIERELGPIDVWVNNAMTTVYAPFAEIEPNEYRRATEVTYLGCVHGTMAALKRMEPRNKGTIVQVGSALSYRAIPLQSPYCGAKFAIRGFTDALRCELAHKRSRVHLTMVQMPALNTPQFDWGRNKLPRLPQPVPPIFQPEVAARAIVFAANARRREVWVGRSTIAAILINKLSPGLLDDYLARTGYKAQLSAKASPASRDDNLFEPVSGPYGAHGRFDKRATEFCPALTASIFKPYLLAAGAALFVFALTRNRRVTGRAMQERLPHV